MRKCGYPSDSSEQLLHFFTKQAGITWYLPLLVHLDVFSLKFRLVISAKTEEYEKEIERLKKTIAELLDMVVSLKNRNCELDEKRKKALSDYYEAAVKLEEALGLTWNGQMLKLIQEMIHENNMAPSEGIAERRSPDSRNGTIPSCGQRRRNMRTPLHRTITGTGTTCT